MSSIIEEIVERVIRFCSFEKRVPKPIEYTTHDHKYYIRKKLGNKNEWLVVECGNPLETSDNTYSGSFNECRVHLLSKGYADDEVIKVSLNE